MNDDTPHLRQMPQSIVDVLCARASELCKYNYSVKLEVDGFRESRTPWDATRLANILQNAATGPLEDIAELVKDIDEAAQACQGSIPTNRTRRA